MPGKESKMVSKAHLGRRQNLGARMWPKGQCQGSWTSLYGQHLLNAVISATTVWLSIYTYYIILYIYIYTTNFAACICRMLLSNSSKTSGGALEGCSWYANSSHDTGSQSNPRWRHVVVDLSQSAHVAPHRSVLECWATKLRVGCFRKDLLLEC